MTTLEEKSKEIVEYGAALPLYTCGLGEVPENDVILDGYAGRVIAPWNSESQHKFELGSVSSVVSSQQILTLMTL